MTEYDRDDDDLDYGPSWWLGVVLFFAAGVVLLPFVWLGIRVGCWLVGVRP